MFDLPKEIIIWDSEWTCWSGSLERWWTGLEEQEEHRELIQIGAVLIETDGFCEQSDFQVLIKPVLNKNLGKYCIDLTCITQEKIDSEGVGFLAAYEKWKKWANPHDLFSWTRTDLEVLAENCKLWGMVLPFKSTKFFDVRVIFWKHGVKAEKYNSGNIIKAFGKDLVRKEHDALNDARTIVDGLRELAKASLVQPP